MNPYVESILFLVEDRDNALSLMTNANSNLSGSDNVRIIY